MLYKASVAGKKVILVPEHYTTKTCSCCGVINENVGSKEIFQCSHCNLKTGRDMNASRNMKLKGLYT
jgi:putative transposase